MAVTIRVMVQLNILCRNQEDIGAQDQNVSGRAFLGRS